MRRGVERPQRATDDPRQQRKEPRVHKAVRVVPVLAQHARRAQQRELHERVARGVRRLQHPLEGRAHARAVPVRRIREVQPAVDGAHLVGSHTRRCAMGTLRGSR